MKDKRGTDRNTIVGFWKYFAQLTASLHPSVGSSKGRGRATTKRKLYVSAIRYLREHKIEVSIFNEPWRCFEHGAARTGEALLTGGQPDIVGYTHGLFPLSVCAILSTPDLSDVSHKALFPRHPRLTLSLSLTVSAYNRRFNMRVRSNNGRRGNCVFKEGKGTKPGADRLKRIARVSIVPNRVVRI